MVDNPNLGTDFALEDGDLIISNSGDVLSASDADNVAQAIQNALFTEKGTLFYDNNYGFDLNNMAGEKNILAVRSLVKNEILNILTKDPRIQTINVLTVQPNKDNPSQLDIQINATLINGETINTNNLIYPFVQPTADLNPIVSEEDISVSQSVVYTQYNIFAIRGVYLSTDQEKVKTNYFTGGFTDGNKITLGTNLPSTFSRVLIDYDTVNVPYTSTKITNIYSERKQSLDGKTIDVRYNIYTLATVFNEDDTQQILNYANGAMVSYNTIALPQNVTVNDYFLVTYTTKDTI